jgi:hypothetical protein
MTMNREGILAKWPLGEQTLHEACARTPRNLTYSEWMHHFPEEPYHRTCPALPTHPSLLDAAGNAARSGDVERARRLTENLHTIEPDLMPDPQKTLLDLARVLVEEGRSLAEEGKTLLAIQRLRAATRLDPEITLDPEVTAKEIAFDAQIEELRSASTSGLMDKAHAALAAAQRAYPEREIHAEVWNDLCWFAIVKGKAFSALADCDRAVASSDGMVLALSHDARGVGRVMTGNWKGAAEDFIKFAELAEPLARQDDHAELAALEVARRGWASELEAGRDPLGDLDLEDLNNELSFLRREAGLANYFHMREFDPEVFNNILRRVTGAGNGSHTE